MEIYLDLIFFLNYFIDFLLLLTTSLVLKRNIKLFNIFKGALIGSLSIILLFIELNNIELFFIKIIISILMILVTFKYKNLKYFIINYIYLYIISIFMGGFLYLINDTVKLDNKSMLFINNGKSVNLIFLLIAVPLALFLYIKQNNLRNNYNNYYKVLLTCNNTLCELNGYMDTGNTLKDKLTNKPVIFIKGREPTMLFRYISVRTVKGDDLIRVYKGNIEINELNIKKDVLVSFIDNINIDNVDCILNREVI